MMVRRRPMYWLTQPAIKPPLSIVREFEKQDQNIERNIPYSTLLISDQYLGINERRAIHTQFPMIVARVARYEVKFFVTCRYVGYRSCIHNVGKQTT